MYKKYSRSWEHGGGVLINCLIVKYCKGFKKLNGFEVENEIQMRIVKLDFK